MKRILILISFLLPVCMAQGQTPTDAQEKEAAKQEMLQMRAKLDTYLNTKTESESNPQLAAPSLDSMARQIKELQDELAILKAELQNLKNAKPEQPEVVTKKFDNILAVVYFEVGSSTLSEADKQLIKQLIAKHSDKTLQLVAYTDWTGNNETNQLLSDKRALAVQQEMTLNGFSMNQIKTYARGKMADESQNLPAKECRRVEIRF